MKLDNFETELEREQKKCRQARQVKSCEQCCRYHECMNNELPDWNYKTMIACGNAIVESIGFEYCKFWKLGCRGKFLFTKNLMRSQFIDIITGHTTCGEALEETLAKRCEKEYGEFDKRHKQRVNKFSKQVVELEAELKNTKNVYSRRTIRDKIYKLKGDMYL